MNKEHANKIADDANADLVKHIRETSTKEIKDTIIKRGEEQVTALEEDIAKDDGIPNMICNIMFTIAIGKAEITRRKNLKHYESIYNSTRVSRARTGTN